MQVAGRVDEAEAPAAPGRLELDPVSRDARGVVRDGRARAEQPVDEGRLADVLPADDGDRGTRLIAAATGQIGGRPRAQRRASVDRQVGRVDHDRVGRRLERVRPRVAGVALDERVANGAGVDGPPLARASVHAALRVGLEEELERGIREHDGADVAPLHHGAVCAEGALQRRA